MIYGDITLNELFYQKSNVKCCYQKCRKKYLKRLNEIKSTMNKILKIGLKLIPGIKLFIL